MGRMKYSSPFIAMAKYKSKRWVEPAYDDEEAPVQEQAEKVGGYQRKFITPKEKRPVPQSPLIFKDVRPEIIKRFESPYSWTHSDKDDKLMELVWSWSAQMQESLGTEQIEGGKVFAKALEEAENSGDLGEVQRTTYSTNFYRKITKIKEYCGYAQMDAEKEEELMKKAEEIDEHTSNIEGWEDLSEEDEEFLNRFS